MVNELLRFIPTWRCMPRRFEPLAVARWHSFAVIFAGFILSLAGAEGASVSDLSADWRFHRGDVAGAEAPGFDDAAWETVEAPHPVRIEALVTDMGENQQWEGVAWYRKTLTLPPEAAGKVVQLRFEGAMNRAELFVNGEKRAESIDGYTPFVADLSDLAGADGPITLALRLDNRHSEITGPKPLPILDFHLYHGLYRTAALIIRPPLHITDEIFADRVASGGVFVTFPEVSETAAVVETQVHVRNAAPQRREFRLVTTLRDLDGHSIARRESALQRLEPGQEGAFVLRLDVDEPRLWSPESPHLHYLDNALVEGDRIIDERRDRIGIRRFEVRPGAFVLNGRELDLRGVNHHQEYPYVGNAVPARAQYRSVLKMKRAGFNVVRLGHYPHSPEFMEACDELGLIVINPILGWQYNPRTEAFKENRLQAARTLVRRDRNHASSLLWELSLNETAMSPEFVARLHRVGHEEYPGDQMVTVGWVDGYDVKVTARQTGSTAEFAEADFPAFVSEYGDWEYYAGNAGLNQDKWENLKDTERNSRQLRGDGEVRLLQQATNLQEAHNENRSTRAFGDAYWVMYDYNRGYAPDHEASGIMDIFRLPKFSYFFFQSQRGPDEKHADGSGGPVVHVASWWTEDSPLNVRVFSNCDEVELFLNGRSLGRQSPDTNRISQHLAHPPFTFAVNAFEAGELRAVAYRQGEVAATHAVQTPGAPERLELALDLSGKPLAAGGDLVFAYARVVDAAGVVVPDFTPSVRFEAEGPVELIGDNPIRAEAGIATILLKTQHEGGTTRLRARAGDLRGDLEVRFE